MCIPVPLHCGPCLCVCIRLLLGSCGAYQYRLQGPHSWHRAEEHVKKVPVTGFMLYGSIFTVALLLFLACRFFFFILDHVLETVDDDI